MFLQDLKRSIDRCAPLAGALGLAAAAAFSSATAIGEVTYGDDCDAPPTCELIGFDQLPNGEYVMYVPECPEACLRTPGNGACSDPTFCAWVDSPCGPEDGPRRLRVALRPDIDQGDPAEEVRFLTDRENRQKVFFEIPGICEYEEGEQFRVSVRVKDLENDETTRCVFWVKVVCGKRPACFFNGAERAPRNDFNDQMMEIYDVRSGDMLPELEICARSRCQQRARVEMISRPPFMEPIGHRKGARRQRVCIESKSGDYVEPGFAEGTYWAKFKCTDLRNGRSRILKVGFRYTDPEPEPEPQPICAENETGDDNNSFDDATAFSAGDCVNDDGFMFSGTLDVPVFINGDVDFYNISGLTAGAAYTATIVDGMSPAGTFTDTMLGWFAGAGNVIEMDDNSGPLLGYSEITFIADETGGATLAVGGHGDDDFDGQMDLSMSYDEFGFGDYEMSIKFEAPPVMPLERRADLNTDGIVDTADLSVMIDSFGALVATPADLNGDGVVDTSDLGMLISVFGVSSN